MTGGTHAIEDPVTGRVTTWFVPLLATVGIALFWIGLAVARPTVTYHVAPGMVAVAWPLLERLRRGPRTGAAAAPIVAAGLFVALTSTGVLLWADALQGPALVGGSATGESVVVALVAAVWGLRLLSRREPGLLVRLLAADAR